MASITFVEHDGTRHAVDIEEGQSLMQAAVDNGVPGIDADCGGDCACGTCHVIVAHGWISTTGSATDTATEDERQMLELTPEKTDASRLSCQIKASAAMDGMLIHLPEFQM